MNFKDLQTSEERWERAISMVDYPVTIVPLWFKHEACVENPDELKLAKGETITGRDTQFHGVCVERVPGDPQIIATVTGTYGTLHPREVYTELKADLEESNLKAAPAELYISGNGGRAVLSLNVDDTEAQVTTSQRISMRMSLDTSVDGTSRHSIRLVVCDDAQVELVGFTSQAFNVGARHTTTIGVRHTSFKSLLLSLANEWINTIVPMAILVGDSIVERNDAFDIFRSIIDANGVPEKHVNNALNSYSPGENETLFGVLRGVSTYLNDSLKDKPERLEALRSKINARAQEVIKKQLGL